MLHLADNFSVFLIFISVLNLVNELAAGMLLLLEILLTGIY